MSVNINTEPIDVTVDGVTFNMQGDPTAGPAWTALLEVKVTYAAEREQAHKELIEALAELAATPEDAEIVRSLTAGTATLERTAKAYIQAVAGFPTKPLPRSKKR